MRVSDAATEPPSKKGLKHGCCEADMDDFYFALAVGDVIGMPLPVVLAEPQARQPVAESSTPSDAEADVESVAAEPAVECELDSVAVESEVGSGSRVAGTGHEYELVAQVLEDLGDSGDGTVLLDDLLEVLDGLGIDVRTAYLFCSSSAFGRRWRVNEATGLLERIPG
jgi:hypothetical protein